MVLYKVWVVLSAPARFILCRFVMEEHMILSDRLRTIAEFLPPCNCLADIGTDHGYIPIYAVNNNLCKRAIACDIKKGPVKIAINNITENGYQHIIETRLGSGLSVIEKNECDVILIAGMGGNLIADIIHKDMEKARSAEFLILQPVQYPEELRKFLIYNNFTIVDETMANEGNKFYPIIKAISGPSPAYTKEVYYYTGTKMIDNNSAILLKYINHKLHRLDIILEELSNSENYKRREEIVKLKHEFEEVKACLKVAVK